MNLHSNLSKHEFVKGLLDTKLVKDKVCNDVNSINKLNYLLKKRKYLYIMVFRTSAYGIV